MIFFVGQQENETSSANVFRVEGSGGSNSVSSDSPQPPTISPSSFTTGVEANADDVTFDTQPTEGRMPNSSYSAKDTLFTWADITGTCTYLHGGNYSCF